jgi:hypothetical protein
LTSANKGLKMKILFHAKVRCGYCKDLIKAENDTDWVYCSCGKTAIMGVTYINIRGDNYENLSEVNFEDVPPFKEDK